MSDGGLIAVITGASRGFDEATAKRLAREPGAEGLTGGFSPLGPPRP